MPLFVRTDARLVGTLGSLVHSFDLEMKINICEAKLSPACTSTNNCNQKVPALLLLIIVVPILNNNAYCGYQFYVIITALLDK